MKLSVIISVFNEEKTLKKVIETVQKVTVPGISEKELIIVNDASTDNTPKVLDELSSVQNIKIINHTKNTGKGGSVKDGFLASTGDIVIIQDADLEYDPNEFPRLIKPITDGYADVVYGSRFIGDHPHRVIYFWHYVGNSIITLFSNMMSDLNLTDMETCYKVFTRQTIDDIKNKLYSKRFGIEPEITARVKHYRIYEVGITYKGRTYAEGKKIGWKDGVSAIWTILRANLFSK